MVAVGLEDPAELGLDELDDLRILAEGLRQPLRQLLGLQDRALAHPFVDPQRRLHLQEEAGLVGGIESGLRRAPGVEAQVVQAVVPSLGDQPPPGLDVGGRIAGAGEDAALERAAQHQRPPVQRHLAVASSQFPEAESLRTPVELLAAFAREPRLQFVEIRRELIPEPDVPFDRNGGDELASRLHRLPQLAHRPARLRLPHGQRQENRTWNRVQRPDAAAHSHLAPSRVRIDPQPPDPRRPAGA